LAFAPGEAYLARKAVIADLDLATSTPLFARQQGARL
jgi:hypothetical protein